MPSGRRIITLRTIQGIIVPCDFHFRWTNAQSTTSPATQESEREPLSDGIEHTISRAHRERSRRYESKRRETPTNHPTRTPRMAQTPGSSKAPYTYTLQRPNLLTTTLCFRKQKATMPSCISLHCYFCMRFLPFTAYPLSEIFVSLFITYVDTAETHCTYTNTHARVGWEKKEHGKGEEGTKLGRGM